MRLFAVALWVAGIAGSARAESLEAEYPPGTQAIVRLGDTAETITTDDVLEQIRTRIDGLREAYRDPQVLRQNVRALFEQVTVLMVLNKVLDQEAKRMGMSVSEAELDREEEQFIRTRGGGDREKFKELLSQSGQTIETFRRELRENVLRDKVLANYLDPLDYSVTPAEIRKFYDDHPEDFQRPERIRARFLCLTPADGGAELAESLKRQVEAGADFTTLVSWYGFGGATPPEPAWSLKSELDPVFQQGLFPPQIGTITGPLNGRGGAYLVKIEEHEPERKETFDNEDTQERISNFLINRQIIRAQFRARAKLVEKAMINPPELKARILQELGEK